MLQHFTSESTGATVEKYDSLFLEIHCPVGGGSAITITTKWTLTGLSSAVLSDASGCNCYHLRPETDITKYPMAVPQWNSSSEFQQLQLEIADGF